MHWSNELLPVYSRFKNLGKSLHGYMYECSQKRQFPKRAWTGLSNYGFMSAIVDKGLYDGLQWMAAALNGFVEGTQDGAFCISPIVHASMGVRVINEHGNAKLKEKYLNGVCSGEKIIAFASTEASCGGTDAYKPDTTITITPDGNYLNGKKWHVTNAGHADVLLVWARDSVSGKLMAVIVEPNFPGVKVYPECAPGGARTSPVAPFDLNNVKVPDENIIRVPHGAHYLTSVLIAERILSAFPGLAIMRMCINKCFSFTRERRINGSERLIEKYNIKSSLSEMDMTYQTASAYAHKTLEAFLSGDLALKESSILKVMSVRSALSVIMESIHVCASYGLQDEAQLCQSLLDAVSVTAGGGTEFAHKEVIFSQLKREHKQSEPLWVSGEAPWAQPAKVFEPAQDLPEHNISYSYYQSEAHGARGARMLSPRASEDCPQEEAAI